VADIKAGMTSTSSALIDKIGAEVRSFSGLMVATESSMDDTRAVKPISASSRRAANKRAVESTDEKEDALVQTCGRRVVTVSRGKRARPHPQN
jgi:hypothetical protein